MELGQQLKAHRKELGISQDELAEKIFVSRQSISNWENNKTYPDIHTLLLLAETFGVSLDELIKGDVEEMKEEINAQERAGFNRDSLCFAIFGIVTVLSIAPLYAFLDYIGCLIWALIVGVAGYFCGRVELYKTMFDIQTYKEILAFQHSGKVGQQQAEKIEAQLGDPGLDELLTKPLHDTLSEDIELLDGAAYEFNLDKVRHGMLTPVFFGSALTNFGGEPFLADFLRLSPPPLPRDSSAGPIDPRREDFSAFVFKIQANMNKAHRDRIAFIRICSGKFERGMDVFHVQGGKKVKLAQGTQLMASEREIVEEAYAGDIIGVFDPGIFSIGDTLTTAKTPFAFAGIPTFAPEHFSRVSQVDTMKRKQFVKGMEQIAQEGAIQIFKELGGGMEEVIVGVVGVLQFEVLEYRLKNEYNVDIRMQNLPYSFIRWIENEDCDPKALNLTSDTRRVEDFKGRKLLLFTNAWSITWAEEHNKALRLSEVGRWARFANRIGSRPQLQAFLRLFFYKKSLAGRAVQKC